MVTNEELEGFRRDRYFARSWALLTRDQGWIKPVLLMAVALLVPVVGWLGVAGYLAEWARLTAWGVNAAPKQKGVRVGECIASGWRVFVVALGWGVCWDIVRRVLERVPLLGDALSFVFWILGFFVGVVILVAELRATVYQRLGAGYQLSAIKQMVMHDPAGLARIMGIGLLAYALMSVVVFVVVFAALASVFPQLAYLSSVYGSYYSFMTEPEQVSIALQILGSLLGTAGPTLLVLLVIGVLCVAFVSAILYTSVGLWMRQFNVPAWGRSEDPLPPFVSDPRDLQWGAPMPGPSAPATPVAPDAPTGAACQQPVTQTPAAASPAPAQATSPVPQQTVTQPSVTVPVQAPVAAPESAPESEQHAPIPMPPAAPEVVAAAESPATAPQPAAEPSDELVEVTPIAVAPVPVPSDSAPDLTATEPPAEAPTPTDTPANQQ